MHSPKQSTAWCFEVRHWPRVAAELARTSCGLHKHVAIKISLTFIMFETIFTVCESSKSAISTPDVQNLIANSSGFQTELQRNKYKTRMTTMPVKITQYLVWQPNAVLCLRFRPRC